jgi:dTDP-4-amino-4,6-dideoxygalactose transaminase
VEWQGLTPVFCDVDPSTHNLDPEAVERRITARSSAIIGVHLWGRPCPVEALEEIAARHKLALVFDAAHAFGCTHRGRPIGGFGNAEVFSFHATKVLNSFEGGAVATNDDDLADRLRVMRNFGFTGYDHVESVGTNGKLTEVAAAMGLTSLESLDRFIALNRQQYHAYREVLSGIPGVALLSHDEQERRNYQYIVVEIDQAAAGVTRDAMQAVLLAERILARRYFFPGCHRMAPYCQRGGGRTELASTDRLASRVLCLPSGSGLEMRDIAVMADIIKLVVENSATVMRRLRDE